MRVVHSTFISSLHIVPSRSPEYSLDTEDNLKRAIQNGYRHLDGAEIYLTELEMGNALKASPHIHRGDFFITSKVHPRLGIKKRDIEGSLRKSLEDLQTECVSPLCASQESNQ